MMSTKLAVREVVAETFQTGVFSKTWWCRAKFKRPVCHKIHVVLADGKGSDTPGKITSSCQATGEALVVKPWSATK